jgi:hypothetical protein
MDTSLYGRTFTAYRLKHLFEVQYLTGEYDLSTAVAATALLVRQGGG